MLWIGGALPIARGNRIGWVEPGVEFEPGFEFEFELEFELEFEEMV